MNHLNPSSHIQERIDLAAAFRWAGSGGAFAACFVTSAFLALSSRYAMASRRTRTAIWWGRSAKPSRHVPAAD